MVAARWIVPEENRDEAADRYHEGYKPHVIQDVEAVIVHYTGSTKPRGTRKWLSMADDYFVSVHFIIDRDGTIWQLIALDERGAHAGGKSSKLFDKGNVNGRTIGIEIMNAGPLKFEDGELKTLSGKKFTGAPISAGGSRPERDDDYEYTSWEAYPPVQIDAVVELLKKLSDEFPVLKTNPYMRITGHENVDPSRKMDPGPAFPWEIVRQRVFGEDQTGDLVSSEGES